MILTWYWGIPQTFTQRFFVLNPTWSGSFPHLHMHLSLACHYGTVWRLVLFIIAGDCERHRRGCLRLRAESVARLRSWLCLIVWDWLVNGAASRVRLRPLCTFQDGLVIFLLRLQPLHCVISWWVQSGSLHLQENHQVLDCEGFRPKPGVTSFKKNPLIAKSWGLNWRVILMKFSVLHWTNRVLFIITTSLTKSVLTSSNSGKFHFRSSWKLPLCGKNMIIILSPAPLFFFDWHPYSVAVWWNGTSV